MENETKVAIVLLLIAIAAFLGSYTTEQSMLKAIKSGELYTITHNECVQEIYNKTQLQGELTWPIYFQNNTKKQ